MVIPFVGARVFAVPVAGSETLGGGGATKPRALLRMWLYLLP